ncbi:uncharacterized protein GBIM_06962, partial [Gryllus bimaculatus]
PLVGVVGPASSSVAIQVQNLLQLFQIPQVGYSTTSKDLSDKSRFNYFLRVVPSDYYQAQVMVDLVRRFNWTYVSAVNTDGKANHIVLLSRDTLLVGEFDGWADRADVTDGLEAEAQGSVSIRIHSPDETSFDEYYTRLSPFNNTRNPWFREFWQWRFNCVMPTETANASDGHPGAGPGAGAGAGAGAAAGAAASAGAGARAGDGKEKLSERYKPDPKLSFIIKAIYTMAYGLHSMQQALCGPNVTVNNLLLFPSN